MSVVSESLRVYAKIAESNRLHIRKISIANSPVFAAQEVVLGRLTAVVGSHGSGKSYFLKILEESLPKYGNEPMMFPPASRTRGYSFEVEAAVVKGQHVLHLGPGWQPEVAPVDLSVPQVLTVRHEDVGDAGSVTALLGAHRAFGEYEIWMQEASHSWFLDDIESEWICDRSTLKSINRILGRNYMRVRFCSFNGDYEAPFVEVVMSDGSVRTPFEMSSGELWVLFCIWELERSKPTDIVLIDEPESYLSPRGHVPFIDEIARKTLSRGFQTILATHSETMIRRLPAELLRLAVRGREGSLLRGNVSHDEVMAALGYEQSIKQVALVEDTLAAEIFRTALQMFGIDHGRSWDIMVGGGFGEVERTWKSLMTLSRLVPVLILDGDQRKATCEENIFFLPGGKPEEDILAASGDDAANRLGVPAAKLESAISFTEGTNHQRVLFEISNYLGLDEHFVKQTLITSWLSQATVRTQALDLVTAVEAAIRR